MMRSGGRISILSAMLVGGTLLKGSAQDSNREPGTNSAPLEMVLIGAGEYRPLFRLPSEPRQVPVKAFYLDTTPVTVRDFLQFIRSHPRWTRSQVRKIFADEAYLQNWQADFDPGTTELDRPVTFVSWFAAKAYAQWRGKRLPTTAEWEWAAAASATRKDGSVEPAFKQELLHWYTAPGSDLGPVGRGSANFWGVRDLHGLVWEWVLDFNGAMVSADSRGNAVAGLFCGGGAQGTTDVLDYAAFMRTGFRSSLKANYCIHNLGFRCAKDL